MDILFEFCPAEMTYLESQNFSLDLLVCYDKSTPLLLVSFIFDSCWQVQTSVLGLCNTQEVETRSFLRGWSDLRFCFKDEYFRNFHVSTTCTGHVTSYGTETRVQLPQKLLQQFLCFLLYVIEYALVEFIWPSLFGELRSIFFPRGAFDMITRFTRILSSKSIGSMDFGV